MKESIELATVFCEEKEIELARLMDEQNVFMNIGLFTDFADILLGNEEWQTMPVRGRSGRLNNPKNLLFHYLV